MIPPAPPLRLLGGLRRLCRLVHAARFDGGAALQTLQTGDLFTLLGDSLFQGGNFAEQFNQPRFARWAAQSGDGRRRRHIGRESYPIEPEQAKNAPPGVLPHLQREPPTR